MTEGGALHGRPRPVPLWVPPWNVDLPTVLERLRRWQPFDGGALLDDVGAVLDEYVPDEEEIEELAQRLRGHLMRVVDIALACEQRDDETATLIERARSVRSEEEPGDYWKAVAYLRRMAWIVNELHEHLVATRCLKEAA